MSVPIYLITYNRQIINCMFMIMFLTASFLFLLLATAAASSSTQEKTDQVLLIISRAKAEIAQARSWVLAASNHHEQQQLSSSSPLDVNFPANNNYTNKYGEALSDCDKLYDECEFRLATLLQAAGVNHTDTLLVHHDANAWLTAVLTNHRTCLDGLAQVGIFPDSAITHHQNLTLLLHQALAFFTNKDHLEDAPRGKRMTQPAVKGMLISWDQASSKADMVVAKDGSGTHRSINDAVAAVAKLGRNRSRRVVIYVKAGVYKEKVEIERHVNNIMMFGDGIDKTIITGSRNVPDGSTTFASATFGVSGDGFWARDITFENTAGPQKHQAVALRVSSDKSVFYRCSFRAYQDTLLTHSLRQFYRDCKIYGTIDFIFGNAAAIFQNCDILLKRPMSSQSNIITAQGRDSPNENTGISIQNSRVRPAPDLAPVKGSFRSYLGRPWKKYSRAVYLRTDLDGVIDPRGWHELAGSFAVSTLYYAEYSNMGLGASTRNRVNWAGFHVLTDPREASPFGIRRFIQGEYWLPQTGVPFNLDI